MSGGSYEYLCYTNDRGENDIFRDRAQEMLRSMADRLTEIGDAEDAAGETEDIIAIIAATQRRVAAHVKRLSDVWHEVEWMDSGDSGIQEVRAALAKYRGET